MKKKLEWKNIHTAINYGLTVDQRSSATWQHLLWNINIVKIPAWRPTLDTTEWGQSLVSTSQCLHLHLQPGEAIAARYYQTINVNKAEIIGPTLDLHQHRTNVPSPDVSPLTQSPLYTRVGLYLSLLLVSLTLNQTPLLELHHGRHVAAHCWLGFSL